MRSRKEQKLIERRMALNETRERMRLFISELEPKRKLFIDKAKLARKQGAPAQEAAAKAALKQVVSQQKLAERMLLDFEIMTNMSDINEMSERFLKDLSVMGKQMEKLTVGFNHAKVGKALDDAVLKAQVQSEKINEYLDAMNIVMDSGYEAAGGVGDEEIDDMIGREDIESEDKISRDIESKLAALDSEVGTRA